MEKYYTPKEVGEILQIQDRTVVNLIRKQQLEGTYISRHYRISETALQNFINKRTITVKGE